MNTNINQDKKEDNKVCSFLKIISTILYIAAFVSFVVGVIKIIVFATSKVDIFYDDLNYFYENESTYQSSSVSISELISCFVNAVVLAVWGTAIRFIANAVKNKSAATSSKNMIKTISEKIMETAVKQSEIETKVETKKKSRFICAYCGNEINEDDRKCPCCGANKKIKKD
jgi:hypothetical protein